MRIVAALIITFALAALAVGLVAYRNIRVEQRDAEYARRIGYTSRRGAGKEVYESKTAIGCTVASRLSRAGIEASAPVALALLLLASLAAAMALHTFLGAFGFVSGIIGVVSGALGLLSYLGQRRAKSFGGQLASVLPMAAQHLRAGMTAETAFAAVVQYAPEPAKTEFARMSDEVRFGRVALDKALGNMAARTGDEDARFLATAVGVQKVGGGNLADLLDSAASRIEAKQILQGDIDAITSQGRFASKFIAIIPFLILAIVVFGAPDIGADFWASPLWPFVVGSIAALDALALLSVRRIYKMPTD